MGEMDRRTSANIIKKAEEIEKFPPYLLAGIIRDYLDAKEKWDSLQLDNCIYWYMFVRDNAIRRGDDVSGLPKRLKRINSY